MDEIDKFAAAFRSGLMPTVAKKTPWAKMTPASQQTYRDGAMAAMNQLMGLAILAARHEFDESTESESGVKKDTIDP